MSNCLFCYPDRTLTATLSGSNWSTALPLANLQNRLKQKVARSTVKSPTFDIDLGSTKPLRMLALIAHNACLTATVTLSFSAVSAGGYELGHVVAAPLWGDYYPAELPIDWSEDEFWSGTIRDAATHQPPPDYYHVLPQTISARYIRVEISNEGSALAYFQVGRCFVATGLQPTVNLDYGVALSWKQDVQKATSIGGVDWFDVRSQGRELTGTLGDLSLAEGMVMVFERQRVLGQECELYFVFDPDDTLGLYKQRSFLCRFGDEDPLQYPFFNKTSGSFRLVEVR